MRSLCPARVLEHHPAPVREVTGAVHGPVGELRPVSPRRTALAGPVDGALAAIADPTRWQVLTLLATFGEATATSLAARLPISRPAIAMHLAVLHRAGLVRPRRLGREVRYHVRADRLDEAARWVARVAAEWRMHSHGSGALVTDAGPVPPQT